MPKVLSARLIRALLDEMLQNNSRVRVLFDPKMSGVVGPDILQQKPALDIGLNMAIPIPDLTLDAECLSATLSFNGEPQYVRIPWNAMRAYFGQDDTGFIFTDDGDVRRVPAASVKPPVNALRHVKGGDA